MGIEVGAMIATLGDMWDQYCRWYLMKLAWRPQFRPDVGIEWTLWERKESDKERRGSLYYVVLWTQPSCISNVCLHKPWALGLCSSTQRDAICPTTHTNTHIPSQTEYRGLSDKLSTFVHCRNVHWTTGSSPRLLLFLIQRFPPLVLRLGRLFTAGSAWHLLTWHWATVNWLMLVAQHHSHTPSACFDAIHVLLGDILTRIESIFVDYSVCFWSHPGSPVDNLAIIPRLVNGAHAGGLCWGSKQ